MNFFLVKRSLGKKGGFKYLMILHPPSDRVGGPLSLLYSQCVPKEEGMLPRQSFSRDFDTAGFHVKGCGR